MYVTSPRFGVMLKPTYNTFGVVPNDIVSGGLMGQAIMKQLDAKGIKNKAVVIFKSKAETINPSYWREGDGNAYILTGPEMEAFEMYENESEALQQHALRAILIHVLKTPVLGTEKPIDTKTNNGQYKTPLQKLIQVFFALWPSFGKTPERKAQRLIPVETDNKQYKKLPNSLFKQIKRVDAAGETFIVRPKLEEEL